jgi:flagellar hook-basal body complex protein FliE
MALNSISPLSVTSPLAADRAARPQNAVAQVGQTFSQALDQLSATQANSDQLIQKLAAGENVDLHNVMIAAEQADISFRVALALRDKLVEAYQEMMRMQV